MFDIRYKFEVQVECIPSEHNIRIKIILISTHCMEREKKKGRKKCVDHPRHRRPCRTREKVKERRDNKHGGKCWREGPV